MVPLYELIPSDFATVAKVKIFTLAEDAREMKLREAWILWLAKFATKLEEMAQEMERRGLTGQINQMAEDDEQAGAANEGGDDRDGDDADRKRLKLVDEEEEPGDEASNKSLTDILDQAGEDKQLAAEEFRYFVLKSMKLLLRDLGRMLEINDEAAREVCEELRPALATASRRNQWKKWCTLLREIYRCSNPTPQQTQALSSALECDEAASNTAKSIAWDNAEEQDREILVNKIINDMYDKAIPLHEHYVSYREITKQPKKAPYFIAIVDGKATPKQRKRALIVFMFFADYQIDIDDDADPEIQDMKTLYSAAPPPSHKDYSGFMKKQLRLVDDTTYLIPRKLLADASSERELVSCDVLSDISMKMNERLDDPNDPFHAKLSNPYNEGMEKYYRGKAPQKPTKNRTKQTARVQGGTPPRKLESEPGLSADIDGSTTAAGAEPLRPSGECGSEEPAEADDGEQAAKKCAEEERHMENSVNVAMRAVAEETKKLDKGHSLHIVGVERTQFTLEETCVCKRNIKTATYEIIDSNKYAHTESRLRIRWRYDNPDGEEVECCVDGAADLARSFHSEIDHRQLLSKPTTIAQFAALEATYKTFAKRYPVENWLFRRAVFSYEPSSRDQVVSVVAQYALGLGGTDHNDVPPPYTNARRSFGYLTELDWDTARMIDRGPDAAERVVREKALFSATEVVVAKKLPQADGAEDSDDGAPQGGLSGDIGDITTAYQHRDNDSDVQCLDDPPPYEPRANALSRNKAVVKSAIQEVVREEFTKLFKAAFAEVSQEFVRNIACEVVQQVQTQPPPPPPPLSELRNKRKLSDLAGPAPPKKARVVLPKPAAPPKKARVVLPKRAHNARRITGNKRPKTGN